MLFYIVPNSFRLILGESGTGKELVAQVIHYGSERANAPFVAVNCSAIPHELAGASSFGSLKGTYTGAISDKKGYFEEANGGTLFLDEIGDMPLALQAKLLRVLEDGKVTPVGGSRAKQVDVRVVSATHVDIHHKVSVKQFRQDLYFRLASYVVQVPALRERRSDIEQLVQHFLALYSKEMGAPQVQITPDALTALQQYHFPGNVRELKNMMEYALIRSNTQLISSNHLPFIDFATQQNNLITEQELHPAPDTNNQLSRQTKSNRTSVTSNAFLNT